MKSFRQKALASSILFWIALCSSPPVEAQENGLVPVGEAGSGTSGILRPNPIRFVARLDGLQSKAINATPLETRNGTGIATVVFDTVSGNLSLDLSFQGLIAEDITLGDPLINPDGSPPPVEMISGNFFDGAGLFLVFIHVGSREVSGPIAVDIINALGLTPGFTADPDPIRNATEGRIVGRVNLFDLAVDGMLLNGVPLDGRNDGIESPGCQACGLIEALLSGNAYIDIWTFNNPFGEIRGQLEAVGCQVPINTLEGLQNAVDTVAIRLSDPRLAARLSRRLAQVQAAMDAQRNAVARQLLGSFIAQVSRRSAVLPAATTNDLICAATNVLGSIPSE